MTIPTYTADMGIVDFEVSGGGREVIIAGKVRPGIRIGRPDLIPTYEREDKINAQIQDLRNQGIMPIIR